MRFAHSNLPRAKNSAISEYCRIARDAVLPVAPVGDEGLLLYDANTGPFGLIRTISGDETYGRANRRRLTMRMLSTAAWVAHNLGLGACFGGLLFGKAALNPSLRAIDSEADRGKILNTTWNRYNVINVTSFATAAATWFPGRLGLSGKEIDQQTRNLVLAKDILFAVGALTGLASVIQGRALTGQAPYGAVPIESGTTPAATTPEEATKLLRSVNQLGNLNILVTGAILGITTVLSMKATKSARFSAVSRFLP
jgi:hypothetical protein